MFLRPRVPWLWPSVVTNRLGVWQEHGSPNLMAFSPHGSRWGCRVPGLPSASSSSPSEGTPWTSLPPCWPPVQTWPRSRRGSSWALVLRSHRLLRPLGSAPGLPSAPGDPRASPARRRELLTAPCPPACRAGRRPLRAGSGRLGPPATCEAPECGRGCPGPGG